jgi:hypothetical protein
VKVFGLTDAFMVMGVAFLLDRSGVVIDRQTFADQDAGEVFSQNIVKEVTPAPVRSRVVGDSTADAQQSAAGALRDLRRQASALELIGEQTPPLLSARFCRSQRKKRNSAENSAGTAPMALMQIESQRWHERVFRCNILPPETRSYNQGQIRG